MKTIKHEDIVDTLRRLIKESPYTYAYMEKMSGVPKRYISRFMQSGSSPDLRLSHTLALCKLVGIRASFKVSE